MAILGKFCTWWSRKTLSSAVHCVRTICNFGTRSSYAVGLSPLTIFRSTSAKLSASASLADSDRPYSSMIMAAVSWVVEFVDVSGGTKVGLNVCNRESSGHVAIALPRARAAVIRDRIMTSAPTSSRSPLTIGPSTL